MKKNTVVLSAIFMLPFLLIGSDAVGEELYPREWMAFGSSPEPVMTSGSSPERSSLLPGETLKTALQSSPP